MLANNPLNQYFRQPAIYIKLPSKGSFYPEGAISIPANGEFPVYPMTAIDEITYRTPDALFNGSAVVNVVQNCVPSIHNAWVMPAVDVDTVLISIRIASYGHSLDVNCQCPSCKTEAEYTVDLRTMLDKMTAPDYYTPVVHSDMEFYFKPLTYKDINENNQLQFEEQRMIQAIASAEVSDEDRVKTISEALKKITEITVKSLAMSISLVKTPTAMVSEFVYIEDLLRNCDRHLFGKIRDHIIKLKQSSELQPVEIKCSNCGHQYQQNITLDMTSFFADAS